MNRNNQTPADFADALLCIYPVPACAGDYFINVSFKRPPAGQPQLAADGPLFDGARLCANTLPQLVRCVLIR